MRPAPHRDPFFALALAGVLLLVGWAYFPGLDGTFLFDDYANLPALGETGPVRDGAIFWRYITSGKADSTGRPLALLTFLIDADNWPAEPRAFKRTNLLIHLLNAGLLAVLLRRLGHLTLCEDRDGRQVQNPRRLPIQLRVDMAAIFATLLWAAHPLLVSTTLYVVQRQAMLPATCALLGILGWLKGRELVEKGNGRGFLWMFLALATFSTAGIASKANGVLLPLYILILECILLIPCRPLPISMRGAHCWLVGITLVAPAGAVVLYLIHAGLVSADPTLSNLRGWTPIQRLVSEPRILLIYLSLLWVPRPYTTGLFNDQIHASLSLFEPVTTAFSALGVVLLIGAAIVFRKKALLFATSILFFFGGHLIESTVLPLELYFEHRNYVPALLMFWPLCAWLMGLRWNLPVRQAASPIAAKILVERTLLGGLICLACSAALLAMTRESASLWGKPEEQALVWGALNPGSPRAQAYAAQTEIAMGAPEAALSRLRNALHHHPSELQLTLNLVSAECAQGFVTPEAIAQARHALQTAQRTGMLFSGWAERSMDALAEDRCGGLDLDALNNLLDAALHHSTTSKAVGDLQNLHYLQGLIHLQKKEPGEALGDFLSAVALQHNPGLLLQATAQLGSHGYPFHGAKLLQQLDRTAHHSAGGFGMPAVHAWVLERQGYWAHERDHLARSLEEDMQMTPQSSQAFQ